MRPLSTTAKLLVSAVAVTLTIVSCGRTQLPGEHQGTTGAGAGGGKGMCQSDGQGCRVSGDCCNSDCNGGTCNPPNCGKLGKGCANGCCGGLACMDGHCEMPQCYPPQNVCIEDASCCSGICGPSGTCEVACQNKGTKCTRSSQCCANNCGGGVCIDHGTARARMPERRVKHSRPPSSFAPPSGSPRTSASEGPSRR